MTTLPEQLRAMRRAVAIYRKQGNSREWIDAMNKCYDAFGATKAVCHRNGYDWSFAMTKMISYGVLDLANGVTTPRHLRRMCP